MPNALLVYPEFPASYWSFKFALEFLGKRSAMPPLGLLTVAGMFPERYDLRVVDLNVATLTDADLDWADLVFTSSMLVQKDSLYEVVARARRAGTPVVAGGPHPTTYHETIREDTDNGVAHYLLGETEETFAGFLRDLESGCARQYYQEPRKPSIALTPLPRYDLIDLDRYSSLALQFSRGCPYNCEFCDITKLFGRVPRTKSPEQLLGEFDLLYRLGWRGPLFLVDDNFIGNRKDAMQVLPEVARWQEEHDHPFSLYTEASMNLASHPALLDAMQAAGFNLVFVGIESPNQAALVTTKKKQNTSRHEDSERFLLNAVRTIQGHGIEVTAGFIIGLDGDTEFDSHIRFIQEAGIPMAMAGLLTVIRNTDLHHRLTREGRMRADSTGNNTDITLNFDPELPEAFLLGEYRRVLATLYQPSLRNYFDRCLTLLDHLRPTVHSVRPVTGNDVRPLVMSLTRQLFSRQGPAYARFLWRVVRHHRRMFPEAVRLAIMGYHFEKVTRQTIATYNFREFLQAELERARRRIAAMAEGWNPDPEAIGRYVSRVLARAEGRYQRLHADFRDSVAEALVGFREGVREEFRALAEGHGPSPSGQGA